jgi:serine/threonine protein kinase
MSNKLHFYTKYSKEKIKISDKPFASGGEGAIYAIASPRSYRHLVAKIYYPEKRTKEREAKMHYLMQHPPIVFQKRQAPSIGWVQDVIYKDQRFLGILLIKIEGKKLTKLTLSKLPRRADKAWQRFAFQDPNALKLRLRTCFNLAVVIYQIHESGQYVLVDLKPDNVLMQPNGLLAVVDMDSVEVIENGKAIFAAPVATPEYTPPEHYTESRTVIEETWDHFSLGVIFYQLLLGLHPFAAASHSPYDNLVSIHDKIQHGLYVHHTQKKALFKVIPPPHKRYKELPPEIQGLFQSCFEEGAQTPSLRPSALDWCIALAEVLELPFRVPFHKLPKFNLSLSEFNFSPKVFVPSMDLSTNYNSLDLSIPDYAPVEKIPIAVLTKTKVQEEFSNTLKDAYNTRLQSHRDKLISGTIVLPILILFAFILPSFLVLGVIASILTIAYLFYAQKQDVLQTIRTTIFPKLTSALAFDEDHLLQIKKEQHSRQQQLIKERTRIKIELQQLGQEISATQTLLSPIKIGLKKKAAFTKEVELFNQWIDQTLFPSVKELREKESIEKEILYKEFVERFKELNTQTRELTTGYRDSKYLIEKESSPVDQRLKQDFLKKKKDSLKTLEQTHEITLDILEEIQIATKKAYESQLKTTLPEHATLYTNYKEDYKKRLASLEEKAVLYKKSHDKTLLQIEEHKREYLKASKALSTYTEKLKTLNKIEVELNHLTQKMAHNEGEKIKIETLQEWEESYLTKIYIKDLLLGQVEQLKELKDKEA